MAADWFWAAHAILGIVLYWLTFIGCVALPIFSIICALKNKRKAFVRAAIGFALLLGVFVALALTFRATEFSREYLGSETAIGLEIGAGLFGVSGVVSLLGSFVIFGAIRWWRGRKA